MSEYTQEQVHQMWLVAAEKIKDRVIAPTLYRAVELGHGIAIDGGFFVLGFSNADMPMAGHLRSSQHLAIVEQCINEVTRQKLRLKVIEGTGVADYANYKRLQETRETAQSSLSQQRQQARAIEQAWEQVTEQITRGYAKLQHRQFAQVRAQFIMWAYNVINDAVNKSGYNDNSDEVHKRALGRVFEKLATVVEVPSSMLAYEFLRLREDGKLPKQ